MVGVANKEWVTIFTPRALISAKALVTARMPVLQIDGRAIHQVGLPYHWGWKGMATGDVVNDLLAISQEPNVRIMETKGLVCNLIAGRPPSGSAALDELDELLKEKA
jgi:formate dehydrogenase major subunit